MNWSSGPGMSGIVCGVHLSLAVLSNIGRRSNVMMYVLCAKPKFMC